ncbi:MAG: hypothetical protein SFX73_01280 [Kofleriaceae bacterium]|nr:hypothetical protein [Kofleriaceae bacterium]
MIRFVALALATFVAVPGCRKGETPDVYRGPITAERISIANERVRIRADWEDTIAQIESEAGKATWGAVDQRAWAVIEGSKCSSLLIKRKRGYVGSVRYQPPIGPDAETDYDECAELAGPARTARR